MVHLHCKLFIINMSKSHLSTGRAGNPHPILENLFNSRTRVKVLKFLFRSYPINLGAKELSRRIQEPLDLAKKELKELEKIGLIKQVKI